MKAARRKPIIISTIAAAIIAIALCYRIFIGDVTFSYIEPDTTATLSKALMCRLITATLIFTP